VRSARVFFVSGITPALSPSCRDLALEMAEVAHAAGVLVATDINYRARLWSVEEAGPVLERLAVASDILITAEADLVRLFGFKGDAEKVAWSALERFGARTLVVTRGAEGGLLVEGGSLHRCAVFPSWASDRIGAGDAFTAGFLYGTLTGREERALEYGCAMAALKHSLPGDTLLTTPAEVERVVARETLGIRR
jgi:2-dehydro-3-deoxygluconokinase